VDVGHALGQGLRLGLAQRAAQRLHLAVDVGFGHVVQVEQHQFGHAAARQRFHRPRTHAAQPDHGDAGAAHARVAVVAVQPAQAAEAALQVGVGRSTASSSQAALQPPGLPAQASTAPAMMPPAR
jgi:hypothetical protein